MSDAPLWAPHTTEGLADPYPMYARLRREAPVYWFDGWNPHQWILTRHRDVAQVLKDRRFGHGDRQASFSTFTGYEQAKPLFDLYGRWMLFRDPPDHTRLRGLVASAFTPARVERLRAEVEAIADRLLNQVEARGSADLIAAYAFPLPVLVITRLLGVPAEDLPLFKAWGADIAAALGLLTPEVMQRGARAAVESAEYLTRIIEERRRNPQDDLISAMIAAEEQGDRLTREEIVANAVLLLFAGHETTVNLVGNGLLALLQHPGEMERLRRSPELIESAVEECLRFNAPVQATVRICLEDAEIGGTLIRAGLAVRAVIGAANRDPEVFAEPDRFDISRSPNPHLAFASGIHFCLGAPLARLEGQIAVSSAVRRLPGLALTGEPLRWRNNINLHGLEALPVTF